MLDDVEPRLLEDLPLQLAERDALFAAAAGAFAGRDGDEPAAPERVAQLSAPVFASPLMVVIAAYVAVHDRNGAVSTTRSDLLDELLAHEQRYWNASAKAAGIPSDSVLHRRVVALATLAGAASEAEAAQLLQLVPDLADAPELDRRRLARWAHDLYPSGPGWWNLLEPDLVSEQLVARTYADQPNVLRGVLERDRAEAIIQPLNFYTRAAPERPELFAQVRTIITERLRALCELAATQATTTADLDLLLADTTLAATLDRAVNNITVDADVLPTALDMLPSRSDLVLDSLALTLTSQLVEHRGLRAAADPATYEPELATTLNNLSLRLVHRGRHDEALIAIQEALDILRRLAAADGATYKADLADTLSNLSGQLDRAGRPDEGLAAIEEALALDQGLAAADPSYEPNVAHSLNNLAHRLGAVGRSDEALTAIKAAVSVYRRLAVADPADYEPVLARSLNNLSAQLGNAACNRDGLAAAQEAVSIYSRLVAADLAAYGRAFVDSLNNLSNHLAAAGRADEALESMQATVWVRRRLAAADPVAYESDLAGALHNLSLRLADAGRGDEALAAINEAVTVWRRLASANPAAYESALVNSRNLMCQLRLT